MPSHARKDIVRQGEIGTYHCWSRCVQQAFLCGYDHYRQHDFSYRRGWIEDLLAYQARLFAVDVGSYSILSNHLHAILRTRPDIAAGWCDEELALRWKMAWPSFEDGRWMCEPSEAGVNQLLASPEKIEQIRVNLSSLSWFLARWKEPIAKLCNAEADHRGHFWEARFGSRELLDEEAVLTCSLYVDLNQVRAGMADSLETSEYCSIARRLRAAKRREAMASREDFSRRDPSGNYRFTEGDAVSLFDDCWLAPLTAEPACAAAVARVTVDRELNPETNRESSPVGESREAADPQQQDGRHAATDGNPGQRAEQDGSAEPNSPSCSTRRRWRAMLTRRRASDTPMLTVSWAEYLRAAKSVAALVDPGASADRAGPNRRTLTKNVVDMLQRWGLNPTAWLQGLRLLDSQCTRVLGTAENMTRRASEASQHCFHGIRLCRQMFVHQEGTTFT
jgi:hypothetical protein